MPAVRKITLSPIADSSGALRPKRRSRPPGAAVVRRARLTPANPRLVCIGILRLQAARSLAGANRFRRRSSRARSGRAAAHLVVATGRAAPPCVSGESAGCGANRRRRGALKDKARGQFSLQSAPVVDELRRPGFTIGPSGHQSPPPVLISGQGARRFFEMSPGAAPSGPLIERRMRGEFEDTAQGGVVRGALCITARPARDTQAGRQTPMRRAKARSAHTRRPFRRHRQAYRRFDRDPKQPCAAL